MAGNSIVENEKLVSYKGYPARYGTRERYQLK